MKPLNKFVKYVTSSPARRFTSNASIFISHLLRSNLFSIGTTMMNEEQRAMDDTRYMINAMKTTMSAPKEWNE
jgi:hypothetical protein